jgi:hypothetical protein
MAALAALGQTKQERGKRLLEKTLAALGGDKYLAMQDRVETGRVYSFYHERLSGLSRATIYTRYLKHPNPPTASGLWIEEREEFGKEGRNGSVLFAGGKGYQITFRGARPLPEETLDRFRDSTLHNIFYILRQRLGEPGLIVEWQRSDVVDIRPAEIVNITDADNRVVTVYLDATTGLPLRQVYVRRDPKTRDRLEELTLFSKYRDVGGGVQWPYAIQRLRNEEMIYQIYSDSVEVNRRLPGTLFELPAGIEILKPLK